MLRIQALLFDNFTLKIFSLVIAILLWFFVIGESKSEIGMDIPIEFLGMPKDVTIVNDVPSTIHIRLQGPATLLRPLKDKPPVFSIDLANSKTGENIILLNKKNLKNVPLGVDVVDISPVTIDIVLDKLIEKELPIVVKTSGKLSSGYRASLRAVPPFARARGTKSYLQKINKIYTKPVNLAEIKDKSSLEVALAFEPDKVKFIEPLKVKVFVSINEERTQRSIKGIRITFVNKPPNIGRVNYSNYFVDLVVDCPQTMLVDKIRSSTKVVVDLAPLAQIENDNYTTLPVAVQVPDKVKLLWVDPPQVDVVFNRKK
ncbi:MAG: YbbR-like domain-containing protein [Deltaproteobacteria bacterium]|nr:YbbR-like domain-containing protein [Deltaproteobacteria bacterium]